MVLELVFYFSVKHITDEKTGYTTNPYEVLTQRKRFERFPSVPDNAFQMVIITRK